MSSRRAFIAATAASVAVTRAAASAAVAAETTSFDARLRMPYRHRQAFASARVAGGAVLGYMMNSLNAYHFGLKEGPGTLHAAAILYGTGVIVGLNDDAWRRFELGKLATVDDHGAFVRNPNAENASPDRNPYLAATSSLDERNDPDDEHGFYHDHSITALAKRGASFFLCNNALGATAQVLARVHGGDWRTIKNDLAHSIVAESLIVPAGVAAVNAAQEARFTLFQASTTTS